jgi:hypothetical protein
LSSIRRSGLVILTGALALGLVACTQGTAGPTWQVAPATSSKPSAGSTAAPITATAAPTAEATTSPSFPPNPDVSLPGFITSIAQPTEEVGGHGGPAPVTLPQSIDVNYWVSGTCEFEIDINQATDKAPRVATFVMRMLGTTESGTWSLSVAPGVYYVNPLDAPGCRFSIEVRAA